MMVGGVGATLSSQAKIVRGAPRTNQPFPLYRAFVTLMKENMAEVRKLLDIHVERGGSRPGRGAPEIQVLLNAGIVLLAACWEAFVEDLAEFAFDYLLVYSRSPDVLPGKIKALVADELGCHLDKREAWKLAGNGWRLQLEKYRALPVDKYIRRLHTPDSRRVDSLFEELVGLPSVSASWKRRGVSAAKARKKLARMLQIRGAIAHRAKAEASVTRTTLRTYAAFIFKIAFSTTESVRKHLTSVTGVDPWNVSPNRMSKDTRKTKRT